MTLKTNLRGQVRQTTLPKWKSLLPLFEAIMNAYQAIEEADKNRVHSIVVAAPFNLPPRIQPFSL